MTLGCAIATAHCSLRRIDSQGIIVANLGQIAQASLQGEVIMLLKDTEIDNIRALGGKLRDARRGLNLSQGQVAVTLGVSVAALSRWENGNRNPGLKNSQQILHWLHQVCQGEPV